MQGALVARSIAAIVKQDGGECKSLLRKIKKTDRRMKFIFKRERVMITAEDLPGQRQESAVDRHKQENRKAGGKNELRERI